MEKKYVQTNESNKRKPIIIAGSCAVESQSQHQELADTLVSIVSKFEKDIIFIMRAALWKPRTAPGGFEGCSWEGISWVQECKKIYNYHVATEILDPEAIAKTRDVVDIPWIGARNAQNQVLLQKFMEERKQKNDTRTVMIKNPMHGKYEDLKGSVQHLYYDKVNKTFVNEAKPIVVARGIYDENCTTTRNRENLLQVKQLKEELDITILVDPSHIAGKRELVPDIVQKGLELGYDGIIVEVHQNPENAWTDARQQLSCEQFEKLLPRWVDTYYSQH